MVYWVKAILPVKILVPTSRVMRYDEIENLDCMDLELDLLEEKRTYAQLRLTVYQATPLTIIT